MAGRTEHPPHGWICSLERTSYHLHGQACYHGPQKTFAACKTPVRLKRAFRSRANLEAEPHPENVVFVIVKESFGTYFDDLKGGVRDIRFSEPIYQ